MALRAEVEKLDVELRKAAAAGFSVGVGGAGAAEESALADETAALQQEAAAAARQRRLRREAAASEEAAAIGAASPLGSPAAAAAAPVGRELSLLYQTSRASLAAEISALEAEVARRRGPPPGEAWAGDHPPQSCSAGRRSSRRDR